MRRVHQLGAAAIPRRRVHWVIEGAREDVSAGRVVDI